MKIAVSGKGGSGKTTVAGILARFFAQQGRQVLAIDADSNPCLDLALGVPAEAARLISGIPHDLAQEVTDMNGNTRVVLPMSLDEVACSYGFETSEGIKLLPLRRIDHAGDG